MTIDFISTDPCSRNSEDACPIVNAGVPPNAPYYTPKNNDYCKACNQIYGQLKKRGIDIHSDVGNVSRPIFNRGMARVRALQYQSHPPSNDDRFYLPLVNEVINYAQKARVNDDSFETKIGKILARFAPPTYTNTTHNDDEQEAEERNGEQRAEYQDDAQGAAPVILQYVLAEMREITRRQARDASRMLVLIAAMDHLSVA